EGTAVALGPGGALRVSHVTADRGRIETEVRAGDVAHLRGDVHRGA
ncbi:biotin--[acetyl-CoA-carboxylase] ligase, partial [Micrococcus endophyticus]